MGDYFDARREWQEAMDNAFREKSEAAIHAQKAAEEQGEYRKLMRVTVLELRATSKLPANLIPIVANGSEDVVKHAVARDCEEALAKASSEAVQLYKRLADFRKDDMSREHYIPGMENT